MNFPNIKKEKYLENPLEKVICQVRFPEVLRIKSDDPVAFQDSIIDKYPNYERNVSYEYIPKIDGGGLDVNNQVTHQFKSEDSNWNVSLSSNFIALTSSSYSYKNWEDFEPKFKKILDVVIDIYKITTYTRVGLRYIDVIKRDKNESWKKYFNSALLGFLDVPIIEPSEVILKQTNLRINPNGEDFILNFNHGLANKYAYILDFDYFYEGRGVINEYLKRIQSFRSYTWDLFRWSITKEYDDSLSQPKG